jgi:hypothetical protein
MEAISMSASVTMMWKTTVQVDAGFLFCAQQPCSPLNSMSVVYVSAE